MSHFCLLSDSGKYVPEQVDLVGDESARRRWVALFAAQFEDMLAQASGNSGRAARKTAAARDEFLALLEGLADDPASAGGERLSLIEIDRHRQRILRAHGLDDPYRRVKDRENDSAVELYPSTVRTFHAMEDQAKWLHLIRAVFAGNLFDVGTPAAAQIARQCADFLAAIENISPRPWHVDHYDRLAEDMLTAPPAKWSKAVIFLDNAGCDLILGVMPLARELALAGTMIVLAANERPSLNDVTADETVQIIQRLAAGDDDLAALIQAGMFEVVSTGSDIPLLDLSDVSDELNAAAEDAELVVLEGMGRGVESNYGAEFRVDALWLAVLKDPGVAEQIGAEVGGCICKYAPVQAE